MAYVPEPIKKATNAKLEVLKGEINRIYNRENSGNLRSRYEAKQRKIALKGYLKTFRIDGNGSRDNREFLETTRSQVDMLLNQHEETN